MIQDKNTSSEKNPTIRFTGLFIPAEILEIEELSSSECMLLAWIDALYCKEHGGCYASNEYFMTKLKIKESTIRAHISHLVELGLVERVSFDGRIRVIKACKEKWFKQTVDSGQTAEKIAVSPPEKYHPPYIENKEYITNSLVATSVAISADADEIVSFFIEKLRERQPDYKFPKDLKKWKESIDKMIRVDKRDPKKIKAMIDWIHRDPFWCSNILSIEKLRAQYDNITAKAKLKSETNIAKKNKEFAVRMKFKYPESYKSLVVTETFAMNNNTMKEISLKLPPENFKKDFVRMFGINWEDLNSEDKK